MSEKKYSAEREVSLIDADVKKWLDTGAPENGLCLKRFRADYVYEGLTGKKAGDIIWAGDEEIIITAIGKRCFEECLLLKETGRKCPLADGTAFGKKKHK